MRRRSSRAMDLLIAVPLMAVSLPVIAAVAVGQRLTGDRGPVLYRAVRVGEGGRTFELLKLRTMRPGAGSPLTHQADPRVTSLGRVLRTTKLDELPQLFNVIRGQMSLVGPRPEDPTFVDWSDPLHRFVFSARPGITGIAQLRFRREERLHRGSLAEDRYRSVILPAKLRLDAWYLRHRSARLDARILLATAATLLPGAPDQAFDERGVGA